MDYSELERRWGSPANIAKAIGVSRQLVSHWRKAGITEVRQVWLAAKIKPERRRRAAA
jgi:hypothetical protein